MKEEKIKKKTLKNILQKNIKYSLLFITFVLVVLLLLAATKETKELIKKINWIFLFIAIICILFYEALNSFKIKILCESIGEKLSFLEALKIIFVGNFLAAITPFQTGGLPLQLYLFQKNGVRVGKGSAVLIMSGLTFAFLGVLAIPIIVAYSKIKISKIFIYSVVAYIIAFIGLYFFVEKPEEVKNFMIKKFNLKKRKGGEKIIWFLDETKYLKKSFVYILKKERKKFYFSLFLTFISVIFYFSIAPLIAYGLGFKFKIMHAVVAQFITTFLTFFFPTPGASGGAEFIFSSSFIRFIPLNEIAFYTLMWRFITFYIPSIIGGIITIKILIPKK